ncbi:unnamed protein product (mitochondrion) [Plasmodiophora brassicae]|uniref:VWFA domain-containing protein n=1 Tax=Plasmodiophora brassicae TaxID=37360 RepID=A0A3P3YEJ7_PLABS|nr:unnamed protein product [Plasmodiophora brassicae]
MNLASACGTGDRFRPPTPPPTAHSFRPATMSSGKSYASVIGIDFGTGGYAVAIAFKKSTGNICVLESEPKNGQPVRKNSCAVLARRDSSGAMSLVSIGYDALSEFAEMEDDDRSSVLLFPSVKMDLYKGDDTAATSAVNGERVPASDVVEMALSEIRRQAMVFFRKVSGTETASILWVLTVPAIWTDASKQVMRQAAIKAGIPDANLILALEPEAASMFCQKGASPDAIPSPMNPDDSYMVVDAGTGTVDITVHQLNNCGKLQDIVVPQGGPWGSREIDKEFVALLEEVFGESTIRGFMEEAPADYLELLKHFESVKIRADLGTKKSTTINMGRKLLFFATEGDDDIANANDRKLPDGVGIDERFGYLILSEEKLRDLYKPAITNICNLIASILNEEQVRETCRTLYLVGGFGASPFLEEAIRDVVSESRLNINILRPVDPCTAVVKGAVLYGQFPEALSSRLCQNNIGICVTVPYDDALHDKDHASNTTIGGTRWCTAALDMLVRCGQRVRANQAMVFQYKRVSEDQNVSVVRLYQSDGPDAKFITDVGVRPIGELLVVTPQSATTDTIQVQLQFGSTEIQATAATGDGKPVKCSLDFGKVGLSHRPHLSQSFVPVDVCFVMDCTGSMAEWIDAAKNQLFGIADRVMKNLAQRDEICLFSSNIDEVRDFITQQRAFGGGDGPEDLLGGLDRASTLNWMANHNRFLVLVADAPCHGTDYSGTDSGDSFPAGNPDGLTPESVFDALRHLNLQIIFTKITNHTDLMISMFKTTHPIREVHMDETNCVSQFGRTLSSEIVGHIRRREN